MLHRIRKGESFLADQHASSPPIFTYLDAAIPVRSNEHVAIFERGMSSPVDGAEFVSEGLRRGHRCCCVAPAALRPRIINRLRQFGVEVERQLDNQTLRFPWAARGEADLMNWARRFFAEAEAAGAPAVRWWEEGVWPQGADFSTPQFFELHSHLNYLVKQYPSVALCKYDVGEMEIPDVFSAIAVHRHLLVEGTLVRDNPFYIPPEKFLAMAPQERGRDLHDIFREVSFDLGKLLSTLAGYGQLQRPELPRT